MKILPELNGFDRRLLEEEERVDNELIHVTVAAGLDSDPKDLEASFEIVKMEKRSLQLQINFEKPLFVSTAGEPDYLGVTFKNVEHFCSEEFLPIKTDSDDKTHFLTEKIP